MQSCKNVKIVKRILALLVKNLAILVKMVRILAKKRQELFAGGAYHQLMQELRLGDVASYRNFVQMDAESFDELLHLVAPLITHTDTIMRRAIPPGEILSITLRFLASGKL